MSGRRTETVVVGGQAWEITQVGPDDALRLQFKLFQLFSEPVAKLLGGGPVLAQLLQTEGGDLPRLMAEVFALSETPNAEMGEKLAELLDKARPILQLIERSLPSIAARIDPEDIVYLSHLLLVGNAKTNVGAHKVAVDADTYNLALQQVGPWQRLRLLREAVRINLGPSGAAARTSESSPPGGTAAS